RGLCRCRRAGGRRGYSSASICRHRSRPAGPVPGLGELRARRRREPKQARSVWRCVEVQSRELTTKNTNNTKLISFICVYLCSSVAHLSGILIWPAASFLAASSTSFCVSASITLPVTLGLSTATATPLETSSVTRPPLKELDLTCST